MPKRRVLFVCTHNSARSQMAEGMLRAWAGEIFDVASAGTVATGLRPEAVRVMGEIGIDISAQRSKTLDTLPDRAFDTFITVCDQAQQACPVLPGVRNVDHWSIEDPSGAAGDDDARLDAFRRAREDLATRVRRFIATEGLADPAPR